MMKTKIKIQDIAYALPENIVTNAMLKEQHPAWNFVKLDQRVGVEKRHIARADETALDLAHQACLKLLEKNPGLREKIDGIIFCTQSGDYIMPSNSCVLHGLLELKEEVFATDYNLACSGFVYGLAFAQGLIAGGTAKNILLVTADTYSKYINESDRSTRVLFGDGAAVSWISESNDHAGVKDIACATTGVGAKKFMIPAGGCRLPKSAATAIGKKDITGNIRTPENIHMDGSGILTFVKEKIPPQIDRLLAKNQLQVSDVDLFIFHQASKMALEFLYEKFALKPEQIFSNLPQVGNTVSASIPIALKDAIDAHKIKKGDKVMLVGFGVGLSYASALLEY
jgi:3-oxoacyl-[acyl-carrier-protein] synthase-3